ncbi:hypothetical protein HDV00_005056 [Rhizophlyctis rosea]|nr:hypothetical protein HDV00_005056 [Rhizophlyctis rosea]
MKVHKAILQLLSLLAVLPCLVTAQKYFPVDDQGNPVAGALRTIYVDAEHLWTNREYYRNGYPQLNTAINRVLNRGISAANDKTTYTVTYKPNGNCTAPSGNPHDYLSLARYFFPDETKPPNFIPYKRWDGHINYEIFNIPYSGWMALITDDIFSSGLSYFWTGNVSYAEAVAKRIRDMWVNPETQMTPHLRYADWVKGYPDPYYPDGSLKPDADIEHGGIIDMSRVYLVLDGLNMIADSGVWTAEDDAGFRAWLEEYANWLRFSPRGILEVENLNNHAVWYDVQLYAILIHLGHDDEVRERIQNTTLPRFFQTIAVNGTQPLETLRPLSWFYVNYNIQGLFVIGWMAQAVGLDMFSYQTYDGRSIKRALDYLLPYALNNGTGWPHLNLGPFDMSTTIQNCKEAFLAYRDPYYLEVAYQLQGNVPQMWNPSRLWTPFLAFDGPQQSAAFKLGVEGAFVITMIASTLAVWL